MIGQRFGRLVIQAEAVRRKSYRHWSCLCDCGKLCNVRETSLKSGHTQSCGCLGVERRLKATTKANIKHGRSKTRIYNVWASMLHRCRDPKNKRWSSYGGRGISVCDKWLRFENFLADMGERPNGLTLDRIDVNGNYEPSNCRWATQLAQCNNTRFNVRIEHAGEIKTIAEWARSIGIQRGTLWSRLKVLNMPIEKAMVPCDYRRFD